MTTYILIGMLIGVVVSFIYVKIFGIENKKPQAILHIDESDPKIDKYVFEFLVSPEDVKKYGFLRVDIKSQE